MSTYAILRDKRSIITRGLITGNKYQLKKDIPVLIDPDDKGYIDVGKRGEVEYKVDEHLKIPVIQPIKKKPKQKKPLSVVKLPTDLDQGRQNFRTSKQIQEIQENERVELISSSKKTNEKNKTDNSKQDNSSVRRRKSSSKKRKSK